MKTRHVLLVLAVLLAAGGRPVSAADPAAEAVDPGLKNELEAMTPDQLAEAMFTEMERMADTLETVTDVETARKAIPTLEEINRKLEIMQAAGEKMEALLSEQQQKALEEKYTPGWKNS